MGVGGLALGLGVPIFFMKMEERDEQRLEEVRRLNRETLETTGETLSQEELKEMRPKRYLDSREVGCARARARLEAGECRRAFVPPALACECMRCLCVCAYVEHVCAHRRARACMRVSVLASRASARAGALAAHPLTRARRPRVPASSKTTTERAAWRRRVVRLRALRDLHANATRAALACTRARVCDASAQIHACTPERARAEVVSARHRGLRTWSKMAECPLTCGWAWNA